MLNNNNMINQLFRVMAAKGINIPSTVNINDPNAVTNYLLQNGKITQDQYNAAYNQARVMNQNGYRYS